MEGSSKHPNLVEMQNCTQQRRTNYKRSHSLPTTKKGLYDIVLSEDLCCNHHECNAPSQADPTHQKVAQALSFENRDLVKVEIEMELANSVPEELKTVKCEEEKGGCSSQGLTGDLHVVTADVEISGSTSDSDTSQWSLDFTPDLLSDNIPMKKHMRRSNSWSFPASFTDPDQILNQDSFMAFETSRKRKTLPARKIRCSAGSGDNSAGQSRYKLRSSCGIPTMRYRNVRATLSLHEQQIQALEQHLEQNAYVPVQLLIGSQGQAPSGDLQNPMFALANIVTGDCSVCYDGTLVRVRGCCKGFICDNCFKQYLTTMINQRVVTIQCPMYDCKKYVAREEIAHCVDQATRDKFYRFILEANCDSNTKTCPHCNSLKTVDKKSGLKKLSYEAKVCCEECDFEWCFPCHAPWHDGMSCKEYWKGDRLLKDWAKGRPQGIINAHRCPKCRVFIQRSSGCDHMTCSRCGTEFCYQCGGRFRGIRYFGNHYSRFSIFGCKYRYKPEDPVERKVVRGAVFGMQLLVLPLIPCAVVLAGLALLVVVAPAFGVKALKGYRSRRKYRKKRERIAREDRELGDPLVLKRYQMTRSDIDVAYP